MIHARREKAASSAEHVGEASPLVRCAVCYSASEIRGTSGSRKRGFMTTEIVLMWAAVTGYVISTALFVVGVALEKDKLVRFGVWAAGAGLLMQLVAMGVRWGRLGRGPMLGYYEMTSVLTICSVALFIGLVMRYPKLASAGIAVMPVALLLIAGAMLAPKGALEVTSTLASYWLVIHIVFADLAFGAFVVSFALAVAYVVRERGIEGKWADRLNKLPEQEIVDHLSGRFVFVGFIFWGIMIASGAIWANEAWGRYWGWDPIETWSLVVWLIYVLYLHLRQTMGWRGKRIAWVAIVAMPVALFCLAGIPLIYHTVHVGYLAF